MPSRAWNKDGPGKLPHLVAALRIRSAITLSCVTMTEGAFRAYDHNRAVRPAEAGPDHRTDRAVGQAPGG